MPSANSYQAEQATQALMQPRLKELERRREQSTAALQARHQRVRRSILLSTSVGLGPLAVGHLLVTGQPAVSLLIYPGSLAAVVAITEIDLWARRWMRR